MALLSAGKVGFVLALSGVAHFVKPDAFVEITKSAFPVDPEAWVQRNGASETALGLALMLPKTRKFGKLGLLGYLGWLGFNGTKVAQAAKAA
jgi:uncharacterized membrane protein